jgi:large subunit ribosomal protein L2
MTTVDYSVLTAREPFKALTSGKKDQAGRGSSGRITTRHQGGGNKKLYREVDFGESKLNVLGRVETIEYDPFRTAFIALVAYKDGDRRYVLAEKDMKVGDEIMTAESAAPKKGNRMMLKNIPVGSFVYNVETRPLSGGTLARSAGSYLEVLAHDAGYTDVRMPSKEIRKIPWNGFATIGQVSNIDWNLVNIGKAGRSRWLGIRPTVRGTVMNPVDHPYGGGEGRQPRGTKRPKTLWGKVTGGRKTRKPKKWSNQFIVQRRPKVR